MTTSHTPGRLHISEDVGIYSSKDRLVASVHSPIYQSGCDDARRLVACWNVCEGLPTSDLENSALPEIMTNLMEAKVQRDALLEAVSLAEHTFRHYANLHAAKGPDGADKALRNTELADRMEAAIAEAEGKA